MKISDYGIDDRIEVLADKAAEIARERQKGQKNRRTHALYKVKFSHRPPLSVAGIWNTVIIVNCNSRQFNAAYPSIPGMQT